MMQERHAPVNRQILPVLGRFWRRRGRRRQPGQEPAQKRVRRSSRQVRERRDGRLEIRLEAFGRKELTRWVPSRMPSVQVLAPRQLKERVKQRMRQGVAIAE
jgi:predicted DNA-binding transcriptional regulator YafY